MDMKAGRPTLGRLLRDLRARNGWTLKEMSERTEIPVSTLSKVERDRLTLTYDKLLQVSEALKIPLSELFADPTSAPPGADAAVTARRSLGYLTDAVRVTTKNYDYYYMCPELRRKRMIPVIGRIRAKSLAEFGELVQHSGEEYIYVLEGAIAVHTAFYDPVILKVGESIYVDSTMGHAYVAEGCEEATVLAVCSSADESLMESLMSLHGEDARAVRAKPAQPVARQGKSRKR
ncbi:MAG TPA: XRE family transcriptional regulator [Steroidobacteraceae bacterium]